MTNEEAIKDIEENILPIVGGKSLLIAIEALKKAPTALDHIHNVDGWIEARPEVDAIPLDWIRNYISNLKAMGVVISIRDAQAVSVMVDKYMMEQNGNATCGPDYCEIGGAHND